MARDNVQDNVGIAWDADPDPEVFEYLVYMDTQDLADWLEQIDMRRRGGRAIVGIGKNADQVKETFHDVLGPASLATVEVLESGSLVALDTIVDDRLILTKASLLRG